MATKVKGHSGLVHDGIAVVNTNTAEYQGAINRLKNHQKVENLENEVAELRELVNKLLKGKK